MATKKVVAAAIVEAAIAVESNTVIAERLKKLFAGATSPIRWDYSGHARPGMDRMHSAREVSNLLAVDGLIGTQFDYSLPNGQTVRFVVSEVKTSAEFGSGIHCDPVF
jgi:hypothetical protein